MTALPGAAQGAHSPAGCLVVTLRRFQTLIVAMAMIKAAKRWLVVVPGGLVPDLVGCRVRPIAEPGGGLGERQRAAFGI
jgi:hypothetical protein